MPKNTFYFVKYYKIVIIITYLIFLYFIHYQTSLDKVYLHISLLGSIFIEPNVKDCLVIPLLYLICLPN